MIYKNYYNLGAGQKEISGNEKCNITFGKPGTENATISIKLPPSVLENQVQLGTIVNTINKALTLTREVTSQPVLNQVGIQVQIKIVLYLWVLICP